MALSDSSLRFIFSEFSLQCISWTLHTKWIIYNSMYSSFEKRRRKITSTSVASCECIRIVWSGFQLSIHHFTSLVLTHELFWRYRIIIYSKHLSRHLRLTIFRSELETTWEWFCDDDKDMNVHACVGVTNWIDRKVFRRISSTQRTKLTSRLMIRITNMTSLFILFLQISSSILA